MKSIQLTLEHLSATNGCEAWAVAAGGVLAARSGHPVALMALTGVSLLALLWLLPIRAARRNRTLAAD